MLLIYTMKSTASWQRVAGVLTRPDSAVSVPDSLCSLCPLVACGGSMRCGGLRRALADPLEQEEDQRPSVVLIMGK